MMDVHASVRTSARLAALGLLAALLPAAARAQAPPPVKVAGRVVDAAGKPARGADVASFWVMPRGDSRAQAMPIDGVKTAADGSFSIEVRTYGRDAALVVMDGDRKAGALAAVKGKGPDGPLAITLGPLTRVHGSFTCKELGRPPQWSIVYVSTASGARVLQDDSEKAEFDFPLPRGDYKLWAYGTDVADLRKDVKVEPGAKDLDLKSLDFEATIIARHKGKEPPALHVTDARGAKKDVKLSDYKGKWVLMEFWGFW
ncbi:TlpA family protein disulfide reductase [Aquisphaera giovannonii]|uniref:TlpA family protein disulfide reductase n=1 Tax=Aquisphaera giovannonii TaxID=406548 RepID=UPI0011DF1002|nr:hypothetical protein [Aquisphaera giovannonii]